MDNREAQSFTWLYVLALAVALAIFVVGIVLAAQGRGLAMLAAGGGSVVAVLIAWPLAMYLRSLHESSAALLQEQQQMLIERLQQISVLLNMISEQQLLSDRAKAVAFRDKDRDALRRAIQEEISQQDFEAALVLADDIENAFGYKQEAERLRAEIRQRRDQTTRRQINEAMGVIERLLRGEQWEEAREEAQRLMQRFPNDEQVQRLPTEVNERFEAHKKQLLDSFRQAIARRDIDGGIEMLKQLDDYLTPDEAESLQEDARSLFREKLNMLRQQFASAVQEHRWPEALRVGDEIVRDFPNSGIAREVREKMDALRQRAAEPAEATA